MMSHSKTTKQQIAVIVAFFMTASSASAGSLIKSNLKKVAKRDVATSQTLAKTTTSTSVKPVVKTTSSRSMASTRDMLAPLPTTTTVTYNTASAQTTIDLQNQLAAANAQIAAQQAAAKEQERKNTRNLILVGVGAAVAGGLIGALAMGWGSSKSANSATAPAPAYANPAANVETSEGNSGTTPVAQQTATADQPANKPASEDPPANPNNAKPPAAGGAVAQGNGQVAPQSQQAAPTAPVDPSAQKPADQAKPNQQADAHPVPPKPIPNVNEKPLTCIRSPEELAKASPLIKANIEKMGGLDRLNGVWDIGGKALLGGYSGGQITFRTKPTFASASNPILKGNNQFADIKICESQGDQLIAYTIPKDGSKPLSFSIGSENEWISVTTVEGTGWFTRNPTQPSTQQIASASPAGGAR